MADVCSLLYKFSGKHSGRKITIMFLLVFLIVVHCIKVSLCMFLCVCSSVESSSPSLLAPDNTLERSFFIRMKSTLTKRGVHIKSSGYKVGLLSSLSHVWVTSFDPDDCCTLFPVVLHHQSLRKI